jgi:hypothetical protein
MAQGRGIFLATVMGLLLIQAVFSLLTQPAGYAAGNVYCVVPPGESTGPFAACDQVFTSVQAAVDTAVGGEEIWVASGVYTDVHEYNGRYQVAYVDKSLTIRGGYTIPFSDPPDPMLHVTTLDARDSGRVLFVTDDISVTIEGLHLTGGWSYAAGFSGRELGGGVYVDGATILLQNNVIAGNRSGPAEDFDVTGYGAGIYLTAVQATLRDNLIQDNLGYGQSNGGGLAALHSTVWLQNNRIMSNTAGFMFARPFWLFLGYGWRGLLFRKPDNPGEQYHLSQRGPAGRRSWFAKCIQWVCRRRWSDTGKQQWPLDSE